MKFCTTGFRKIKMEVTLNSDFLNVFPQYPANTTKYILKNHFLCIFIVKWLKQKKSQILSMKGVLFKKIHLVIYSGITSVTVLTSPYPDGQKYSCKHDCFYCPNEPGQPRSYLKKEPAVARANRNEFDACRQTIDRLDSLLMCGHEIDKIEFILEGGTYTEYPVDYLERFHRDLILTAATYFEKEKQGTDVCSRRNSHK